MSKNEDSRTENDDQSSLSIPRSALGQAMDMTSAVINDHLIAARFAAFSSIALLTAYGISNTPLFFRFRTVSEIPASYFLGRRRLYGRIIGVRSNNEHRVGDSSSSIEILVRNLSPVGLLLPTRWFEFLMTLSPSNQFSQTGGNNKKVRPGESKNELLRVQIAGIQSPSLTRQDYNPEYFLERLAKQRELVSMILLGRKVPILRDNNDEQSRRQVTSLLLELGKSNSTDNNKIDEVSNVLESAEYKEQQIAICRLSYRPKQWQIFPTDIAKALVEAGNANVGQSMLQPSHTASSDNIGTKIVDTSQRIQDLRNDVKYLDSLAQSEFEAAKKSMGMWSVPEVRKMKREVVEEVDFQTKANIFQKFWRWIRGG
jgi:hypothetical protein